MWTQPSTMRNEFGMMKSAHIAASTEKFEKLAFKNLSDSFCLALRWKSCLVSKRTKCNFSRVWVHQSNRKTSKVFFRNVFFAQKNERKYPCCCSQCWELFYFNGNYFGEFWINIGMTPSRNRLLMAVLIPDKAGMFCLMSNVYGSCKTQQAIILDQFCCERLMRSY